MTMTRYHGHCSCSQTHKIGLFDRDCENRIISYIDDTGLAWETRLERDCTMAASYFHDACLAWKEGEPTPSPLDAAMAAGCLTENLEAAVKEALDDARFWFGLMALTSATAATQEIPLAKKMFTLIP